MSKQTNLRPNQQKHISHRNLSSGPSSQYFLRRWASTSCRWYGVADAEDRRWSCSFHTLCLSVEIESRGSMAINEEGAQDPRAGWFPAHGQRFLVWEAPGYYTLAAIVITHLHRPSGDSFSSSMFRYLEDTFLSPRGAVQTTLCSSNRMYLGTGNLQHRSTVFVMHNQIINWRQYSFESTLYHA